MNRFVKIESVAVVTMILRWCRKKWPWPMRSSICKSSLRLGCRYSRCWFPPWSTHGVNLKPIDVYTNLIYSLFVCVLLGANKRYSKHESELLSIHNRAWSPLLMGTTQGITRSRRPFSGISSIRSKSMTKDRWNQIMRYESRLRVHAVHLDLFKLPTTQDGFEKHEPHRWSGPY